MYVCNIYSHEYSWLNNLDRLKNLMQMNSGNLYVDLLKLDERIL